MWAPNARSVRVVGNFNSWDGRIHPMRSLGSSGIWELFIPDVEAGDLYKFEIVSAQGDLILKTDPYAFQTEPPPSNACIVHDSSYEFQDEEWMSKRATAVPQKEADDDLRGAPGLVAADARRGTAQLP